jgi:hypothetical protein
MASSPTRLQGSSQLLGVGPLPCTSTCVPGWCLRAPHPRPRSPAGVYCQGCNCLECSNVPERSDAVLTERQRVLQRDAMAFTTKVGACAVRRAVLRCVGACTAARTRFVPACRLPRLSQDAVSLVFKAVEHNRHHLLILSLCCPPPGQVVGPAHLKGCKCKRSRCVKKYCDCFDASVKCSDMCK